MTRSTLLAVLFLAVAAAAQPRRLHLAAVAPEGTDWAAALHHLSHSVEAATAGSLVLKWTLGGMGGDEPTLLQRILEGDLDGAAGAILCEQLAPSLRVLELIGLASSHREASALLTGIRGRIDGELRPTPFRMLAVSLGLGHRVLISRRAVHDLDELRRGRWWLWNLDELLATQLREMGVQVVPLPLDQAAQALDDGRVDGFIAVPGAALTFGLYTRSRWFTDLSSAYLPACLVMSAHTFEGLGPDGKSAIHAASLQLQRAVERAERKMAHDLDGTFANGLNEVPMSPKFRAAFAAAGRAAIDKLGEKLAPPGLIKEARVILERAR